MSPYLFIILVLLIVEPHLTMIVRALVTRIRRSK